VTLEILDGKGELVRRLTSVAKEREAPEDDPDAGDEPEKPLPAEPGLQRASWDLRHQGATRIKGAKVDAGDPETGPLALPGTYTARLTVDGRTQETPIEVRPDPRSSVPRADLEAQLALALGMRDDLDRLSTTVHELRAVREQLLARAATLAGRPEAAGVVEQVKALASRCDALEERLHNPKAQIAYDILAMPGGAKLYSRLAPLYSSVGEGDGPPTQGTRERHAALREELDARLLEWKALLEVDLPALNARAREAGMGFVTAPAR
jgi:hypothetical protein